jgi:outer membrane protein assembly factor BamB
MPPNQLGEQVGTIGPVTREHVILLNGQKLMALEPLTGKSLWIREGVAPGTDLFGDEEFLYAIPPEGGPAVVYNSLDGTIRGNRAIPPERPRIDFIGRHVVTFQLQDSRQVLSLHDPWSGKNVWSRSFEDTAQVTLIEFDEAAVLEPSGKFTIVSLADGSVRFEAATEPEPQLQQIYVIRSRDHYVLIANTVTGNAIPGVAWGNVTNQVVAVRGRVYGFDRATAKRLWVQEFDKHGIDLQQPGNLPILTFMASFSQQRPAPQNLEYRLTLLDKRTGRLVFNKANFDEPLLYVEYDADIIQKQLELRLLKSALRLTFTDKPIPDGDKE